MKVRDLRASEGGRALLFDRLTDREPSKRDVEESPFRTLSREALRESLRSELSRLLSTRSSTPPDVLERREPTVIDYGLPDYSGWYTRAPTDQQRLAELALRTIRAFEPRLLNPEVRVLPPGADDHALRVHVQGSMRVGGVMEPVSFPLAVWTPDARE